MLWHAMPPELNTARLMAGAGPAPMLQAAAGWEELGSALETQATELAAELVALKETWTGAGSDRAISAATPMVAWLQAAAQHARDRAMRATAQAASYTKALAMTPSLPEIAINHVTHAVLTATNFLGINLVPIGFNETDYFVRMWNQAGGVMDIYQAETVANTTFEPLPPVKPILQPEAGEAVSEAFGRFWDVASEYSPSASRRLAELANEVPNPVTGLPIDEQVGQILSQMGQLGQLNGPMQQLMMPLQQVGALASQAGSTGGAAAPEDLAAADALSEPGGEGLGQLGLLGAGPLSNHPLAGGAGPSVGMGLMHAEALPGAGGSPARTAMMSQLIDRPSASAMPAAAAGSSALGGAAPMGMMGAGAAAGGGSSRTGFAAPTLLAPDADAHDGPDDVGDEDDW
ncbi:PPE family protein [Mycobacterium parmense]|uniref:PPE family immunomodulator PPE68 n=1 Tax=Mycobacterium parmense TaxID=185642 RepID=A0A7I7YZG8_9MYCO|nr:PPE family protein [Mycobacterium parmense]MCV7352744.1 PPE family protein [Mycobacterium parmense]ORW54654.1 hypothetical protein AWC20_19365 [Mycobacterium parmense]BBZ46752.1 PPE family immunomodulator PPE68 [Mycobacterium parmense]